MSVSLFLPLEKRERRGMEDREKEGDEEGTRGRVIKDVLYLHVFVSTLGLRHTRWG